MAKTEKKTQKRILLVIILIIIILLLLRLCTSQTQKESTICDTVSDTIVNDKDYLLEDTISVEPIDTIEVEDRKQAKLSSDLVRIDSIESPVLDTTNVVLSKDTIKTDEGLVYDSEPIIIKDTIVVRDTIIVRDTVELEKDVPLGYKTRMFVTLNYAHSFVPTQSSYGFTWGYVEKNLGLYVGFLSNFNFKGLSSDFVIAQEDMSTGFYNGMIETSRFSVNAGLLVGAKSMYFKKWVQDMGCVVHIGNCDIMNGQNLR